MRSSKLTRGVRNFPDRGRASPVTRSAARPARWTIRNGGAATRCWRSMDFSFDVQTPWWHLDALAELARDFPNTQIIIVHTGAAASTAARKALAGWRAALEVAAAQPNIAIKISGLGRPGLPWTLTANGPIIRDTINIFGPERCMFASNYPGRRPRRLVPDDLWRLPRRRVEPADRGAAHAVPRQRRAHLSFIKRENAVDQKLYDKGMELRRAVMGTRLCGPRARREPGRHRQADPGFHHRARLGRGVGARGLGPQDAQHAQSRNAGNPAIASTSCAAMCAAPINNGVTQRGDPRDLPARRALRRCAGHARRRCASRRRCSPRWRRGDCFLSLSPR